MDGSQPRLWTRARLLLASARDADRRRALATLQLRRQVLQLATLIALAAAGFGVTRAVAVSNREMNRRDAAEWFARGQRALADERLADAVDAFRRATARNRQDRQYTLGLAQALALNGDAEAARTALLALRERYPDDIDINLQLARLAANRNEIDEALRFFRAALYSPWAAGHPDVRRAVRVELIRLLLAHRRLPAADSELIALSGGLPDDARLHLEAARLFVEAGDRTHALEEFQKTLKLEPDNAEALAGAGRTALDLRNYALARRYLRNAPTGTDKVKRDREIVDLVLSRDPLADRIGWVERRRRFEDVLAYARQRLEACLSGRGPEAVPDSERLRSELDALTTQLPSAGPIDHDAIEGGMDLIRRLQASLTAACGPETPLDTALRFIVEAHGGAGQ